MTQRTPPSGAAASACPFVAFQDDRDRRSETPDHRNHCYAEPVPQPRALAHQATYCLAAEFPACPVFLAWAARAAAAPTTDMVTSDTVTRDADVAPKPGDDDRTEGSGGSDPTARARVDDVGFPGAAEPARSPAVLGETADGEQVGSSGTVPADPGVEPAASAAPGLPPMSGIKAPDSADWIPTTAWEGVVSYVPTPGPEEAPKRVDDAHAPVGIDVDDVPGWGQRPPETTTTIPAARLAALPARGRRAQPRPLRAIGSGEWEGAPPLTRQPLVRGGLLRGHGRIVAAGVAVAVLVLAIVALPPLLGGGGGPAPSVTPDVPAATSPGPGAAASGSPAATRVPLSTPSPAPSSLVTPRPQPTPQTYRVRRGDTLSQLAVRFRVSTDLLQCWNDIRDIDLLAVGQQLLIPPRGARCPSDEPSPSAEPG